MLGGADQIVTAIHGAFLFTDQDEMLIGLGMDANGKALIAAVKSAAATGCSRRPEVTCLDIHNAQCEVS